MTIKKNSMVLVRKRTIPIERSPPVSKASALYDDKEKKKKKEIIPTILSMARLLYMQSL
jgi:hypothetical protein